jgi:hypothetical protein
MRHALLHIPTQTELRPESRRILPSEHPRVHRGGDTGRRGSACPAARDPVPFRNTLAYRRVN